MTINKIQQAFEETVLKNDEYELGLEKFDDGTMWGSEDLTNCYEDTTTEMCFSFYQMGLDSKERDFFESKLKEATGDDEEDLSRAGDGYADSFVNLMWKYFKLS